MVDDETAWQLSMVEVQQQSQFPLTPMLGLGEENESQNTGWSARDPACSFKMSRRVLK